LTRNSLLKYFKRHPKGKAFNPQLVEAFDMGIPDEQVEVNSNLTPDQPAAKRKADDDQSVPGRHASLQGVRVFCR
jgi:hypothetical protein